MMTIEHIASWMSDSFSAPLDLPSASDCNIAHGPRNDLYIILNDLYFIIPYIDDYSFLQMASMIVLPYWLLTPKLVHTWCTWIFKEPVSSNSLILAPVTDLPPVDHIWGMLLVWNDRRWFNAMPFPLLGIKNITTSWHKHKQVQIRSNLWWQIKVETSIL